jgi:hypothetical protein
LENDVNVPSKSNKQKEFVKKYFFVGVFKVNGEKKEDPDPYYLSWIRNTAFNCVGTAYIRVHIRIEVKGRIWTMDPKHWFLLKLKCGIALKFKI